MGVDDEFLRRTAIEVGVALGRLIQVAVKRISRLPQHCRWKKTKH